MVFLAEELEDFVELVFLGLLTFFGLALVDFLLELVFDPLDEAFDVLLRVRDDLALADERVVVLFDEPCEFLVSFKFSEFCGQYEWAGEPITEYDDAFYVYEIDDLLPMLGLEDDDNPMGNHFKNRTSDKIDNPVTIGDLTPITKEKIMFIYQDDYQNGWK